MLALGSLLWACADGHRSDPCETAGSAARWPGRFACGEVFDGGWDPDPYELLPWKTVGKARSLDKCQVLYPAGTGTESLAKALAAYRDDEDWAKRAGHDHARVASAKAACHVMALRDPVDRMESGWRSAAARTTSALGYVSLNEFVSDVRCGGKNASSEAYANFRTYYNENVACLECKSASGKLGVFWKSQISYLRRLDPSRSELHVVCLNHFEDDLRRIGDLFQVGVPLDVWHSHNRAQSQAPQSPSLSRMDKHNARFWRDHVFPWDARLYDALCNSSKLHRKTRETARDKVPGVPRPKAACA